MPEYLTTRELATLLRIKERKVYDLAASGEVPCTKVTGKLLFPEQDVREWLADGRIGSDRPVSEQVGTLPVAAESAPTRRGVVLGSHDPLLDWALRESRCGLATYLDGSFDGLERFIAGEGLACGMHVYHPGQQDWNTVPVSEQCGGLNAVLMHFARRQRGLILHPDVEVNGLEDLPGQRIVPRQVTSGAHSLFAHLLCEAGIDAQSFQPAPLARNESDAVLSIVEGHADAAFGLAALAHQHRLTFVPLIEEQFDLLIDRKAYFDQPIQTLLSFCSSAPFADRANDLQGYDVRQTGMIRWNA